MEKPDGKSKDILKENIEKLKKIFPEIVTEGNIDFDKLKTTLGEYVDDREERYNFTWNGKAKAKRLAQTPSTGTLRPCKEESVNWDTTENLFIEGDNLEVLKLLQKTYHKRIKMIYIDPPYNTGNEFVYKDDFKDNIKNYLKLTGQIDVEGKKLSVNSETSGRYHTDWLNMMYPRLKLARNLLTDDGLIFISIDDNEIFNLKKICDEIFGEENFNTCITRPTGTPTGGGNKTFVNEIDYVLVYSKNLNPMIEGLPMSDDDARIYDQEDELGKYLTRSLRRTGGEDKREDRPSMFYPLEAPDGSKIYPYGPTGYESRWGCGINKYKELLENNLIEWKRVKKDAKEIWAVYQKYYLEGRLKQPSNLWHKIEGNKKATRNIRSIFDGKKVFDHPKPIELIQQMIQLGAAEENDIVLDFFAGSATTAHAVLDLSKRDGCNRKFIMAQLQELCDKDSEAFKEGYKTIADIGKERIRRAIKRIEAEQKENKKKSESTLFNENEQTEDKALDLGFKVFTLDSSNIKAWDSDFDKLEKSLLDSVDNIKKERSSEDMLYEILLKYGLDLTLPIEERKICKKTVYSIGLGALIVCLDKDISLDVAEGIAKLKEELAPEVSRVVFSDAGFKDDVVKTNTVQILKQHGIEDVKSI